MFVDLGRFKIISDSTGHQAGDRLLQEIVQRFKNCIRGTDIIARWGRDEFTLLLPHVSDRQAVDAIVQKILDTLKHPFIVAEKPIYIDSHVGIALYPEHGADAAATKLLKDNLEIGANQVSDR